MIGTTTASTRNTCMKCGAKMLSRGFEKSRGYQRQILQCMICGWRK